MSDRCAPFFIPVPYLVQFLTEFLRFLTCNCLIFLKFGKTSCSAPMKPAKPGSRRRKIILYYTLAVVMPGIVLGYFAYRGIRNDQALREKENMRRLEINSQAFFSEIDSSFVKFVYELTDDSIFSGAGKSDPSVLVLFVRDSSGSKKLITHKLLYLPSELLAIELHLSGSPASMKEGLRLEFVERKYPEALRFYQDIVLKTTNSVEKIQALVASSRLYNRMNQPDRAKALYDEIQKDYSKNLLNGQIPLGLLAGLEIMKINQARGEFDELSSNSRQYLELLLHPPCEYDKNQFDMFYLSFKEIMPETDPVTDSIFREIDYQKARTDLIIRILTGSDLITTSGNDANNRVGSGISVVPVNSTDLSAVYLSWDKSNAVQMGYGD